jgi:amidase
VISLADYTRYDGLGLAELVKRRDVAPQELADAAFAAIERVNGELNAVLQRLPDLARAEIERGLPQGPFTGVPFLIKELSLAARGVSADLGSRLLRGFTGRRSCRRHRPRCARERRRRFHPHSSRMQWSRGTQTDA